MFFESNALENSFSSYKNQKEKKKKSHDPVLIFS